MLGTPLWAGTGDRRSQIHMPQRLDDSTWYLQDNQDACQVFNKFKDGIQSGVNRAPLFCCRHPCADTEKPLLTLNEQLSIRHTRLQAPENARLGSNYFWYSVTRVDFALILLRIFGELLNRQC